MPICRKSNCIQIKRNPVDNSFTFNLEYYSRNTSPDQSRIVSKSRLNNFDFRPSFSTHSAKCNFFFFLRSRSGLNFNNFALLTRIRAQSSSCNPLSPHFTSHVKKKERKKKFRDENGAESWNFWIFKEKKKCRSVVFQASKRLRRTIGAWSKGKRAVIERRRERSVRVW